MSEVKKPTSSGTDPADLVHRAYNYVLDFWFGPCRYERLLLFQRAFTLTFLLYLFGWTTEAAEWLTDEGFHLSARATSRAYPAPFPSLPIEWLPQFLFVLFSTTVLVMLNIGGRLPRMLLVGLAVYVQMVDQPSSFTLNKMYVVFFFILAIAPSPKLYELPAKSELGDEGVLARCIPLWPVRLVQATIVIQYTTAGICKAFHGNWVVDKGQLVIMTDVLYTHTVGIYRTPIAAYVVEYTPMILWAVFAWSALFFELFAPIWFIPRMMRKLGIAWGIAFHGGVAVLMKDLIFFSQQMCSTYILFTSDKWCVRQEERLARLGRALVQPLAGLLPDPYRGLRK